MRNHWITTGSVIAALALVTGCSSGETEAAVTETGLTSLSVTSVGLCNELSQYAIEKGVFEANGLDITLLPVQSGSAGIAATQAGEVDVVFASPQAALTANEQGIPLTVVANSGLTTADSQALVVAADSPIQGPADLQGKKVAVNDLNGTVVMLIDDWVAKATGEDSTVEFVALPFADIGPAAVNGTVDAGAVTASDLLPLTTAGTGRSIGNPTFEEIGPSPNAIYVAAGDFVGANRDALTRFTKSMQDVADLANDPANDAERFAIQSEFCKKAPDVIAATPDIDYEGYLDMGAYGSLIEVLKRGGVLQTGFDADAVVADFAKQPA